MALTIWLAAQMCNIFCCAASGSRHCDAVLVQLFIDAWHVQEDKGKDVLTLDDFLGLWGPVIIAHTGQRLDPRASFALDAACHHLKAHHLSAASCLNAEKS